MLFNVDLEVLKRKGANVKMGPFLGQKEGPGDWSKGGPFFVPITKGRGGNFLPFRHFIVQQKGDRDGLLSCRPYWSP